MISLFWKHLVLFFLGVALCVVGYLFLLNLPAISPRSPSAGIIPTFALAAGTYALTRWALGADGMSFAALGLAPGQQRASRFGIGLLGGTVLGAVWLLIVALTTGARWRPNPAFSVVPLLGAVGFHLFNNLAEELAYRGYAFVRLAERYSAIVAALATSTLFALLHWQGGLPLSSVLAGVFTSALIYAAVFARWRSVPLALGVHVAMNVVQDASGLRPGSGSVLSVTYPPQLSPGLLPLALVGLFNLGVAALVMAGRHRHPVEAMRSANAPG